MIKLLVGQCHYQCYWGLSIIFAVHFKNLLSFSRPLVSRFLFPAVSSRRLKTRVPRVLPILELTADSVQQEPKVGTSAHLQPKSLFDLFIVSRTSSHK